VPPPDISLILPAYDEAQRILGTIKESAEYFSNRSSTYEIIVAADGTDGTRELVEALAASDSRIRVIGSAERRGKGRGIREAVALAEGSVIGFADADNKVPIAEYDRIEPHLRAGVPIVIGSRAMEGSRIERMQPLHRQLGSKGFYIFLKLVIGLHGIHDTQCGFKFFRNDVAKRIFRHQKVDGYMFDVEILTLAWRSGYYIEQVPIRWRDDGDSRLQLLRGNIRNVIDVFRIRFSSSGLLEPGPAVESAMAGKSR